VFNNPMVADSISDSKFTVFARGSFSEPPITTAFGFPSVLSYSSACVVAGNMAVAYYDEKFGDLKFVRSLDTVGMNWPDPPMTVDEGISLTFPTSSSARSDVGREVQMLIVTDPDTPYKQYPAIVYIDWTKDTLKYIRASDELGNSWPLEPVTVFVGMGLRNKNILDTNVSVCLIDGYPAIAYRVIGVTGTIYLRYVRATDPLGRVNIITAATTLSSGPGTIPQPSVTTPFGVTRAMNINRFFGFKLFENSMVGGARPALLYGARPTIESSVIKNYILIGNDSSWSKPSSNVVIPVTTDPEFNFTSTTSSIQLADGGLMIIFLGGFGNSRAIYIIRSNDTSWTSFTEPKLLTSVFTTYDALTNFSAGLDITLVNGKPAFAMFTLSPRSLLYSESYDSVGDKWAEPVVLVTGLSPTIQTCLSLKTTASGLPAVSYNDVTRNSLMWIVSRPVEQAFDWMAVLP
jgi:hypothetical protein